ncbi:MAG: TIGR04086 family membrane protein [Firmicutes bacterium]|nr:TIGR04086 family membrane protein [Bacillota bacterium]
MQNRGRSSTQGGALAPFSPLSLILRGILVALGFSFLFLAVNALLIYFSPLSEVIVPYLLFAGTLLSILWGAIYVGKRTEEKGWLRGGLMGLCYVLILFILNIVFRVELQLGFGLLTKLFLGFSFGTLGGILGINS